MLILRLLFAGCAYVCSCALLRRHIVAGLCGLSRAGSICFVPTDPTAPWPFSNAAQPVRSAPAVLQWVVAGTCHSVQWGPVERQAVVCMLRKGHCGSPGASKNRAGLQDVGDWHTTQCTTWRIRCALVGRVRCHGKPHMHCKQAATIGRWPLSEA